MKTIATILLLIICSLTVQPLAASALCKKSSTASCCTKKKIKNCCAKKDKKSCKGEKGNCCGSGICTACACCLTAVVEKSSISFAQKAEKNNLAVEKNKNSLSGFLSSPFQPPKSISFSA